MIARRCKARAHTLAQAIAIAATVAVMGLCDSMKVRTREIEGDKNWRRRKRETRRSGRVNGKGEKSRRAGKRGRAVLCLAAFLGRAC